MEKRYSGRRRRHLRWLWLLMIPVLAAGYTLWRFGPQRSYTARQLGLTDLQSPNDADGDGVDDWTDVVLGARAYIAAALLVDGVCRIENIPQISDVTLFFSILEELGAKVRVLNQHAIEIDCHAIHSTRPSYDLARRIRASYYLLGALLGRFGQATVAMPGGCNFGVRPIDQHIKGFTTMGAEVSVEGGFIHTAARNGRLVGAPVYLDVVSVGATMNIMMAAALAEGTTTIENAAKEPHIVDLANFLNSMGADIRGAGTDTIKIRGVSGCPAALTALFPTKSRRAPIWPPWRPPAASCC